MCSRFGFCQRHYRKNNGTLNREASGRKITRVPPGHFLVVSVYLSSHCEVYHCHEACMYHVLQYKISWYTIMHCLVLFKVGSGRRVFFTQTPLHVHFKYPHQFLVLNQAAPPHLCDTEKEKQRTAKGFQNIASLKRARG